MTNPVKNVKLSGYTGLQAGMIKNASSETFTNAGVVAGGEVNYKGTFLRGQVGFGTAASSSLQFGHTFDIGRNMGLELSANAQNTMSSISKGHASSDMPYSLNSFSNNKEGGQIETTTDVSGYSKTESSWRKSDSRYGVQAKLTFGSSRAKFGVGVEAGYHSDNNPKLSYENVSNSLTNTNINGKNFDVQTHVNGYAVTVSEQSEGFVTPLVSADIYLGKECSLKIETDLYKLGAVFGRNF